MIDMINMTVYILLTLTCVLGLWELSVLFDDFIEFFKRED